MGYSTPIFSPTGGMKISAKDLATYMMMHANNGKFNGVRIISKKSSIEMQTPLSDNRNYGFAIETTTKLIDGKVMVGHTGSAYGLYSAMFFNPDEKFGFVVISNGCHPGYTNGFNTVIRKTVNALYENLIIK
jgi:CubicO group peptidase (beta-lactamase class C family)